MKNTAWTEAALLVALPLGAVWCFWHGDRLVAFILIGTAFAFIGLTHQWARREVKRNEERLHQAAKIDGRYIAEHIRDLCQLQSSPPGELPPNPLAQSESLASLPDLLSKITQGLSNR
jgi:hypothetical protein